jgi:hypothetical protein
VKATRCRNAIFGALVSLLLLWSSDAWASPTILFSQERAAFDARGNRLPLEVIDPSRMTGIKEYRFDLHDESALVIRTNIERPESRGLSGMLETVRRCYRFVQEQSGRRLGKDILLFLLEFDKVPEYYRFEAACYDRDTNWCEVRLVLLDKGDVLHGPGSPEALNDLLFDTLPHELGHDVLAEVTYLEDRAASSSPLQTRWFAEGVCEMLAKGFARQEAPGLWRQFVSLRNVGSVLGDPRARDVVYLWSLENVESMRLESDLYGASMLLLMAWTEKIGLKELMDNVERLSAPVTGPDLVLLMQRTTGLDREEMLDLARGIGERLASAVASRVVPDP